MIRNEILCQMKQSPIQGIIIVLLTAAGLVFSVLGSLNLAQLHLRLEYFTGIYNTGHLHHVFQPYLETDEWEGFIDEKDKVSRLMNLYRAMISSQEIRFLELGYQSILVEDYSKPEKFVTGYEEGYAGHYQPVKINSHMYRSVKSLQFSPQVFSYFDLKLESGRGFEADEYDYQPGQPVPVILGSEYQDIYKLGDELNIMYLDIACPARIVGFFNQDSYIYIFSDICYLDRYMVVPSLNFPAPAPGDKEPYSYVGYYMTKTEGYLISQETTVDELQLIMNGICQDCGLQPWIVEGARIGNIDILNTEAHEFFVLLLIISTIIMIFTLLNIVLHMTVKIKKNMGSYAIHLISGAVMADIKKMIAGEIAAYIITANILALIICYWKFAYIGFNLFPLALSIILGAAAISITARQINAMDISTYLRGKH